jgi:membrane fusion protein, macrolide-specific efflux system
MKRALRKLRVHPWLTTVVAVVLIGGAGVGTYFGTRSDKAGAETTTSVQTVSTGTVRQSVSATGNVAPAQEEERNFSVSGQVTKVAVTEGQKVKKGQTLATIDSAALSASVAQAQASVASDQARVDDDTSNSASDTQIAADKAALTAAQNQLASAKSQLAAATLTSPIDGVVATVNLSAGDSVSGNSSSNSNNSNSSSNGNSNPNSNNNNNNNSSSNSSDPQFLVISTNSWVVNASVDANSVGLIKNGDQAQLTVTGVDATVYGTISSIGLVSSSSSGTASYPVVIDITGSPSGMRDGADVTATLIYKQVSDVVVVPTTALHRNASGGQYVEQVKNGKTVQTTVQVGLTSGGQAQILSGLSAGDKIVIPQTPFTRGGNNRNGSIPTNGTVQLPGGGTFQFPGGQFPGGNGGLGG